MSIQNVIDKVRKLRALATSDNVNEAAAAAAAAERLIQEHALREEQLSPEDERPVFDGTPVMSLGRKVQRWQSWLLAVLARQYSCACWIDGTGFRAVGRPGDLALLRYQATYFVTEILRLVERHGRGKGRTWRNSFCLGAVKAVTDAIKNARDVARKAATGDALARVDGAYDAALALRNGGDMKFKKQGASQARVDADAFVAGKRAGAHINQRSQLSATGARLLVA